MNEGPIFRYFEDFYIYKMPVNGEAGWVFDPLFEEKGWEPCEFTIEDFPGGDDNFVEISDPDAHPMVGGDPFQA